MKDTTSVPLAKKSLGQNFLIDRNVVERMADAIPSRASRLAIEIGTGTGALTSAICSRFDRVVTIEKDDRLVEWLKENMVLPRNCRLVHQDVLGVDLHSIVVEEGEQEAVLIGNLPYNVSTQIVFKMCHERRVIPAACLLFQKEVAERITSSKSKKSYGVLSLAAQLFYRPIMVMELPPSVFRPRPKVVSALVLFERKTADPGVEDLSFFLRVAKAAFSQRRKKIVNALSSSLGMEKNVLEEILHETGIDPSWRAENVDLEGYVALSNKIWRQFQ